MNYTLAARLDLMTGAGAHDQLLHLPGLRPGAEQHFRISTGAGLNNTCVELYDNAPIAGSNPDLKEYEVPGQ